MSSLETRERNHLIDVARVASVGVVVVFHTLLWQIVWSPDGIRVVPWAPGPGWWFVSWFLAIIPVFFVAAGFANAVVVDGASSRGTSYRRFLVERGTRLAGPLTLFLAFFTFASSLPAWAGLLAPAVQLSRQFAQLLWFLVVYLALLMASPALVAAFDRWGWRSMLPFAIAAVVVDATVRLTGAQDVQWLNLALVWPLAHQWGIAYRRGWFRGWPVIGSVAGILTAAVVVVVMVFRLGYPPAAVAWADVLVANLQPPTLAALAMGFGQTCLLGLLDHCGVARELPPALGRLVAAANALLFTVYLWHIAAIVATGALLAGLATLWPAAAGLWLHPVLWLVLVFGCLLVAVPRLARLEWRLIPAVAPGEPRPGRAETAFVVLLLGSAAVWLAGAVVHPAAAVSSGAVLLVAAGLLLVRAAARSR